MDRDELRTLIKDNFPLFIAFCVPLVLLFLFLTAQSINRALIRNPEYSAVFVADYDGFARYKPYTVLVEHGQLVIERNRPEPGSDRELDYSRTPSIFLFDNRTLSTRRLNIDFNNVAPNHKIVSPEITAINKNPLLTERVSPDGYMFSYRAGKAETMVAGLFKSSFHHQGYAIYKGGKIINIVYGGKRITDPQFLAWVDTSN